MKEKFSWIKLSYAIASIILSGIIAILLMSTKLPTRVDNLETDMKLIKEGKMLNDNTKVSIKTFEAYKVEHAILSESILVNVKDIKVGSEFRDEKMLEAINEMLIRLTIIETKLETIAESEKKEDKDLQTKNNN